jgi:hypothetical protein
MRRPERSVALTDENRALRIPQGVEIEFARALVAFLNGVIGKHSIRLVMDEEGLLLERT